MDMNELLQDDEFTAQLKAAKSKHEVVQLLQERGTDVTLEELDALMRSDDEELDEIALDNVAGGALIPVVKAGIYAAASILKNSWRYLVI